MDSTIHTIKTLSVTRAETEEVEAVKVKIPEITQIFATEKIEKLKPKPVYSIIKRFLDILLSLCGLIVLFIPMLIIGIAVKIDSKGPAIYKQKRLGKNGKPFTMRKFRSMYIDAEKNGLQWAEVNDPRVTRVGRFLRNTHLDELPQLFNILAGQMSFIGPRPERAEFYEVFEQYIDGFSQRLLVIPGLTGLAQVNGGYNIGPEEKIVYDIEYIKKRSLKLDIQILFKTIIVVFKRQDVR